MYHSLQDIKDAADEASKDLAKHEKQQIGLEERKKHASGKTKKLKKTIQDVRTSLIPVHLPNFIFAAG
jgi:esterase/lipase